MKKVILVRYGEIFLKGKNRRFFEDKLADNMQEAVLRFGAKVYKIAGRFCVDNFENNDETEVMNSLLKVFGIVSISPAVEIQTDIQSIYDYVEKLEISGSFRVDTKRADKSFPIQSTEFGALVGEKILEKNHSSSVDLHTPSTTVNIDIRENGKTYISSKNYKGLGGMPVGTSGSGLLMLSGGIDSPVAGFFASKRGLNVNALYFHSFPYTSEQAKQKVVDLAKIISGYCGKIKLYIVPFTKIQEEIHSLCAPEFTITIMRRFMFRITEMVAKRDGMSCIITGENLAQVASQTIQGITCSNDVLECLPVLRPLICFDKIEIMGVAKKIGTYDTSNLPYQDCCTVFVPKSPIIKPAVANCEKQETRIPNRDVLINEAIENIEIIDIL